MIETSDYGWQNMKGSGGYKSEPVMRRYGWWISLAMMLSALLHVILFLVFDNWEFEKFFPSLQKAVPLVNNDRSDVTVDEQTLKDLWKEDQPTPEVPEPAKEQLLAEEDLEEPEILDFEPIKLTPEVEEMHNYFAAEKPVMPEIKEMTSLAESMQMDLQTETQSAEVKKQLLEASEASINQPKINLNAANDALGVDTDKAVEEMTKNLSGEVGERISRNFDSLETLLGNGGALPQGGASVLVPTDLLFGFNEYELGEAAKLSLMKLGILISIHPDATYIIKGYTDSIGQPAANLELSQKRADSVKNWLVGSLRLEGYNIEAKGFGEQDPLVDQTGDRDQEKLNRRVEIDILAPSSN